MTPRRLIRIVSVASLGLAAQIAFAQGTTGAPPATGGGTTGTGSTGGRGTTTPTPTIRTPTPTQPTQQPQVQQPPIFVSGRVMLADGTPPPEPVVIERICGGNSPKAEGYTDSRGYFGFELGRQNSGVLQDASQGGGFGNDPFSASSSSSSSLGGTSMPMGVGVDQRLMTCELRARLAGYRSQIVSLANRRAMDNPDVGIILLISNAGTQGTLVSATTNAAPKDARKAYEKGLDQIKKKKPADAFKEFQKATTIYPKLAAAWVELGKLQSEQDQGDDARASFQKALDADPKFVPPYLHLAIMELRAGRWEELAKLTETATKLDPFDYPQAFFFNAIANFNLKNLDAAEKSAKEADRLDTRHQYPQNSQLLGVLLAQRQDFTGAAEQFKNFLKVAPEGPDAERVRAQLAQVEKLTTAAKQQQ